MVLYSYSRMCRFLDRKRKTQSSIPIEIGSFESVDLNTKDTLCWIPLSRPFGVDRCSGWDLPPAHALATAFCSHRAGSDGVKGSPGRGVYWGHHRSQNTRISFQKRRSSWWQYESRIIVKKISCILVYATYVIVLTALWSDFAVSTI